MKKKYPLRIMFGNTSGRTIGHVLILMFLSVKVLAQPGLPGDPAQAPVDSGLTWLLLLGLFYAIRQIRNRKGRDST